MQSIQPWAWTNVQIRPLEVKQKLYVQVGSRPPDGRRIPTHKVRGEDCRACATVIAGDHK
jgi:hypothetical protein